jgi:hypothetical protein
LTITAGEPGRMDMSRRVIYLIAVAAALGCASASAKSGPHKAANLITADEIAGTNTTTAYEAVEKLRPAFLHSHGTDLSRSDTGLPDVYLGVARYGDVNSLRNIPATEVLEIRFYKGAEAATKFGMQNPTGINGVIEVTLKH